MCTILTMPVLLLAASLAGLDKGAEPPRNAIEFTLEDANKNPVEIVFPRERPLLLSLADRKGSKQIPGWVDPIKEEFGDSVEHIGIADLQAVPWLMRVPIRWFFRGVDGFVLMDWEGKVCEQYGVKAKTALILIIDRDGAVLARLEGAADEEQLAKTFEMLDAYFDDVDLDTPPSNR